MTRKNAPEGGYQQVPQTEAAGEPYSYEKQLALKDLLHTLLKRKWIPIACLLTFPAIALIHSLKATPMYKATAKIEIEKESLNLLPSMQDVVSVDNRYIDYYNTQYKILRSNTLADSVVKELRKPGSQLLPREGKLADPQDAGLKRDAVLGMTTVQPVRDSRLVDIVARSPFPAQAARVANTLAEVYIERDLSKKVKAIRAAADKLEEELTNAKENLRKAEEAFAEYKEKSEIVSLNEKQTLVLQELSTLTVDVAAATSLRGRLETRYNDLKALSLDQLRYEEEVVSDKQIQYLETQEFEFLQKVKSLSQTYGDRHPKMIEAKDELANVKKEIDKEIQKVVDEVKNSFLKAKSEENRLNTDLNQKKRQVLEFNRKVTQYGILEREVETNKKIYEVIFSRSHETDISGRTEKSNVEIVDRADVPDRPFRPRTKLNTVLAIVAGLFVGCGGAFFVEYLNDTLEDPKDIELFLGKPFLGAVPVISGKATNVQERGQIAHLSPESGISEDYKKVLAGIQYSPRSNSLKTVLVTSAGPSEGKTTTLTNLGISAARNGKKVLLVDCDLRKPAIHTILGLKKDPGLTDYLIGKASLDEIVQETDIENLSAVARGVSSPNPSGLVSSDPMKELVKLVRDKFDMVLLDSPPCTVVADPLILANLVDAVINVTKSGKFSRKTVARGLDLLDDVNANVLGVVLNEMNERDRSYYYHGYYGYSYRYRYRYYSYYTKEGRGGDGKGEKSRQGRSKPGRKRGHSSSDTVS